MTCGINFLQICGLNGQCGIGSAALHGRRSGAITPKWSTCRRFDINWFDYNATGLPRLPAAAATAARRQPRTRDAELRIQLSDILHYTKAACKSIPGMH